MAVSEQLRRPVGSNSGSNGAPSTQVDLERLIEAHNIGTRDFRECVKEFEEGHGKILRSYYSRDGQSAVILTAGLVSSPSPYDRLCELYYQPPEELCPEFARVLFLADQIMFEAKQSHSLSRQSLILSFQIIHSALSYLFRLGTPVAITDLAEVAKGKALVTPHTPPPDDNHKLLPNGPPSYSPSVPTLESAVISPDAYSAVTHQLMAAKNYYIAADLRSRALMYLGGMFGATMLLTLVSGFVLYLLEPSVSSVSHLLPAEFDVRIVLASLIAGGLGSIFSVMVRMGRGGLTLSRDLSRRMTVLIGGFRPIIGIISGVLLYVVVISGLFPIRPTSAQGFAGAQTSTYAFFAMLAFVAGFSERLVQDILVRTEGQVTSATSSSTDWSAAPRKTGGTTD